MPEFESFKFIDQLYESRRSTVFRAYSEKLEKNVVIKMNNELGPAQDQSLLFHEYELVKSISSPYVIQAYEFIREKGKSAIVFEDIGATTISNYIKEQHLSLDLFYKLALQIITGLEDLHRLKIIHRDIKPQNIILEKSDNSIKIIDFNLSSAQEDEEEFAVQTGFEGSMMYIAPEQTGKVSWPIDFRTDFYMLGVTFYEMISGILPFTSKDPLELVHAHLAKPPPPLPAFVPPSLEAIVFKLLSKNPEERYQTDYGLKKDLEESQKLWEQRSTDTFPLGRFDILNRLHIPQKIYGRQNQINEVLTVFNRVKQGPSETVFILGESGIGKTSFVKELYGSISLSKGVFVSGKFDQFKKNIPYHAISEAFDSLVKHLLGEREEKLNLIKEQLLKELDRQGRAIIDVIPSFEKILGPQPELAPIPTQETQLRFSFLFQKVLKVITSEDSVLVLFLDDLQWADSSSLDLIKNSIQGINYFLFIGAYRSSEVNVMHPLSQMIDEMRRTKALVTNIKMSPLNLQDISQLLNDTLKTSDAESESLVKLINQKTEGNPFFIKQFLKFIYQENLLKFNQELLKWEWDINEIKELKITDNVAELVLKRIESLSENAKRVLGIAAYLGSSFELYTLFKISGFQLDLLNTSINKIVELGFLVKTKQETKAKNHEIGLENIHYVFLHDKIQQAALTLIPLEEKDSLHLKIGQFLQNEHLASFFEILFHYNQCLNFIKESHLIDPIGVSKMNLACAKETKDSGSYPEALSYANAGLQLLDEPISSDKNHDLIFSLFLEKAECQYLLGEREEAEKNFSMLLDQSKSREEYVHVCSIFSSLYLYSETYDKCILLIQKALARYNIKLKLNPTVVDIFILFAKIKKKMLFKKISELDRYYPDQNSPIFHSLLKLLETAYIYTIITNQPNLNFYTSLLSIHLAFTYGFSPDLAPKLFAFTYFLSKAGQKKDSAEMLILSRRLLNQCTSKFAIGAGLFLEAIFIGQIEDPSQRAINQLQNAYRANIEGGYVHLGIHSILLLISYLLCFGRSLEEVLAKQKIGLFFFEKYHFSMWSYALRIPNILLEKLRFNKEINRNELENCISQINQKGDLTTIATYSSSSAIIYYFLEDYEKSIECAELAAKSSPDITKDWVGYIITDLICVLSGFRLGSDTSIDKALDLKKRLAPLRKLTANFHSMYCLLSAKIHQYRKQTGEAITSFQQAIELARNQDNLLLIAAAQEESALFYEECKQIKIAQVYINEAYATYLDWGCLYKINVFETRYANFLNQTYTLESISQKSSTRSASYLDTYSIIKANQALSSEIVLGQLLDKMVQVLIETSGAQRCVFIIQNRDRLYIQAEGGIDAPVSTKIRKVEDSSSVPFSLIFSVFRSSEPLVLHNLHLSHAFAKDPYFNKPSLPLSILSMPIINQGKTIGVLYLENYLSAHAFAPQQLQILNFLSTQAAISLEHALIYAASGRFVPQEFLKLLNKTNITEVETGDQTERFMTLLFCDIREFSKFTESHTSQETFDFVNTFLAMMEPPITKEGGFIDKYMGDAIMALFQEKADNALVAAINMTKQLDAANAERKNSGKAIVRIGIGLNSGPLTVGILGSQLRLEGSVIGDTVNTASRIEDLNKIYGTTLLISQNTKDSITNLEKFHLRLIDELKLRGKSSMTQIWEVLDIYPEEVWQAKLSIDSLFQQARSAFKTEKYDQALTIFEECQKTLPQDTVIKYYINRCRNTPQ